jgi:hypothetical protein
MSGGWSRGTRVGDAVTVGRGPRRPRPARISCVGPVCNARPAVGGRGELSRRAAVSAPCGRMVEVGGGNVPCWQREPTRVGPP